MNNKSNAKITQIISVLMLATILIAATGQPGTVSASTRTTPQGQSTTQTTVTMDPQELEAFMDGLLTAEMADKHIPGAVVAVVQDSRLLFTKGYGYADVENRKPVDPERTLFRIASVSKLITWTAVMQMVEEGKLSLDVDVNEYLDFAIPATFPEPITLAHLMSHTSGFEDRSFNMWKLRAEEMLPLGDYLKANLPARIFPPGTASGYSNYGASLAGYIVERVSGLPFNDYIEQKIFTPLGMMHSTFRQPLPELLAADMAKGYNYSGGEYVAGDFEYLLTAPGGAVSATAADMTRFMIAHLQNGELDGQRIFADETAHQMHAQLYTPDPRLDGVAHGFFEKTINGQHLLGHDGASFLFHSDLQLIPGQNVGLFVSTNGTAGGSVAQAVVKAFMDRYYAEPELSDPQSAPGFAQRIAPYLGEYTPVRGNFTSFEKMGRLMSPLHIRQGSDGILVLSGVSPAKRFAEVEPGLLQDIDKPTFQLVYRADLDGRMFLMNGSFAMVKIPWYEGSTLHRLLFLGGALLFLAALIIWPISFFVGWRKRSTATRPTPIWDRLARWIAALFGLLLLLSLSGFGLIFADILPAYGAPRIFFETPPSLKLLLALSYVLGGLALAMLVFALRAWTRHSWRLGGRIFYSVLTVLAVLLTGSLTYWDLLL